MYEYTTICQQVEKYGFLPWSANTDYPAQGCALGSDGKIYQAKQATGPSSTSIDPTTDTNHTYWDLFYYADVTADRALVSNASGKMAASAVTATELGYLSGVTSPIQTQLNNKANNNAVVHLAGAETITGNKTFSGNVKLTAQSRSPQSGLFISSDKTDHAISVQNTEVTKGTVPSEGVILGVDFYGTKADNQQDRFGAIECIYDTNKSTSLAMVLYDATSAENSSYAKVQLFHNGTTGATYAIAPASDVGGSILTTVNKSKSSNGYFQFGNGLIVQWGVISFPNGTNSINLTYPKPFSGASTYRVCYTRNADASTPIQDFTVASRGKSATGCSPYSTRTNITCDWIAIGY
jgi:hypothetical protein